MNTSRNTGARAKILRALLKQGMLTAKEIEEETGLTNRQVLDNTTQARSAGLVKSGRDDVTRLMGYQITDAGRKWLETNPRSVPDPVLEPKADVKASLPTSLSMPPAFLEIANPEPETVITIDAPDAYQEKDEYLYAIDSNIKDELIICGTDRQNAIDQALNQARLTNGLHHVFRLLPVGYAQPIVTAQFVEP